MPNVERKRGLRFSPEINSGNILTAVTMAVGMVVGYSAFYSRISLLEYRQLQMDQIVTELKAGNAQTGVAIQEIKNNNTRLTLIAEQIQRQLDKKSL